MREQILKAVQEALAGSLEVRITFKETGKAGVVYLMGMVRNGIVSLSDRDLLTLSAVAQTIDWDNAGDRTVIVTLTEKFDRDWFVGRMYRELEKIEIVHA